MTPEALRSTLANGNFVVSTPSPLSHSPVDGGAGSRHKAEELASSVVEEGERKKRSAQIPYMSRKNDKDHAIRLVLTLSEREPPIR